MPAFLPIDTRKRRRILIQQLSKVVEPFCFRPCGGSYFGRERDQIVDAFFFQLSRSNYRFHIVYGVDTPALSTQIKSSEVLGLNSGYPSLTISRYLGDRGDFGCKYEEHIKTNALKVADCFASEALTWFDRFQTPNDIIATYHKTEIQSDLPIATDAPRKVLHWTIYGLMLFNSGRRVEAKSWLTSAFDHWSSRKRLTKTDKEWIRIINSTGIGM